VYRPLNNMAIGGPTTVGQWLIFPGGRTVCVRSDSVDREQPLRLHPPVCRRQPLYGLHHRSRAPPPRAQRGRRGQIHSRADARRARLSRIVRHPIGGDESGVRDQTTPARPKKTRLVEEDNPTESDI